MNAAKTTLPKLPPAPLRVADEDGNPRFGAYEGALDSLSLVGLSRQFRPGALKRLLVHKRWLYSFLANDEFAVLCATVDLGYVGNGFALLADLKARKVLFDTSALAPPGGADIMERGGERCSAHFRGGGLTIDLTRAANASQYKLHVKTPAARGRQAFMLDAELDAVGNPLTVISPTEGGRVSVTQKWAGLAGRGRFLLDGKESLLRDVFGGFDLTNGLLPRHVRWRWAFGCGLASDGRRLGFNLSEGYLQGDPPLSENAAWVDDKLVPLPPVRFSWNPDDMLVEWRVASTDGSVDLLFHPFGGHSEDRNLIVAKSRFRQPIGFWSGKLVLGDEVVQFAEVPGVAEDQDVMW